MLAGVVGNAPGIGVAVADVSSSPTVAGWNMFFLEAAAFFERSERSSCFAGSLRWSVSQLGLGRLNMADLSEAASEGSLVLRALVIRRASRCVGFVDFGGISFVDDDTSIVLWGFWMISCSSNADRGSQRRAGQSTCKYDSLRLVGCEVHAVSTICNAKRVYV